MKKSKKRKIESKVLAKKSEAPEFYCLRKGNRLEPEMAADLKALEAFPQNQRIKLTLSTGRSPSRLRWYWSFLHKIVEATECTPDVESLHTLIKMECGYTVPAKVKGYIINLPRSISFSSMSEEEFILFIDNAIKFVSSSFGITPDMVFANEAD